MHEMFSLGTSSLQDLSGSKDERGKCSVSDEEEPDDGQEGQQLDSKGKKASPWHRVKWTDDMVKLLVTSVLYIDEDVDLDLDSGRRRFTMLKKKGKWRVVSSAMSERGHLVSPQQCEDKFNDLNKRYKRLTDILGRGTSCKVVENPALLEGMKLSDKLKDDARKILSSKHLHYEEMCSYHNRNRLCLLDDPALQKSLRMALRGGEDHDVRKGSVDDIDEDDQFGDSDDEDEEEDYSGDDRENTVHSRLAAAAAGGPAPSKRLKRDTSDREEFQFDAPSGRNYCSGYHAQEGGAIDMNQACCEGSHVSPAPADKSSLDVTPLQLEKQRLHIQDQMLKLEWQHFKWERFSKKKDRELQRMRLENEKMKLENDRLALELKRRELELSFRQKSNQ